MSQSSSPSAVTLLGITFVVLKLTHVIAWSWWWVTAPFWGAAILIIVGAIAALVLIGRVVDNEREEVAVRIAEARELLRSARRSS